MKPECRSMLWLVQTISAGVQGDCRGDVEKVPGADGKGKSFDTKQTIASAY
jgi:hypothetical protein